MSDVLDFLKEQTGRVLSVKEISKEVDQDRYDRDKTWAANELKGLCNKGFIEAINGCYWIPVEDKGAERLEKEREESERERLAALSGETLPDAPPSPELPPGSINA